MKQFKVLGSLAFLIMINIFRPVAVETDARAELEAQILGATVRVFFQSWLVAADESGYLMPTSVGHGTVKDGRYLVTHNHTEIPLSIRHRPGEPASYTTVWLFAADGRLLFKGSLSEFTIVVQDEETLVLAHREEDFFEKLGFSSAEFASWDQLHLAEGMSVAQIDWDGERAHVEWATVEEINLESGVPRVMIDNSAITGASGGGVFLNGIHIANNWRVEEQIDRDGIVARRITTAALNSPEVVEQTDPI